MIRSSINNGCNNRELNDQTLTFSNEGSNIIDNQTRSRWDISGKAIGGSLKGQQLQPLIFGDYFAFAWLVFWPETEIFTKQ